LDFRAGGEALAGLFRGEDRRLLLLLLPPPLLSRFSLLFLLGVFFSAFGVEDSLVVGFFFVSETGFLAAPAFLAGLPGFSPARTRLTASPVST
jgi:hypothetical protein